MKKYKIPELVFVTRDCLAIISLREEDVPAIAGDPIKYLNIFDDEAKQLLLMCAMYLKPKFTNAMSNFKFSAANK